MNIKNKTNPYTIGQKYLIRTVGNHYIGKIIQVFDHELALSESSRISHTYEGCEYIPVDGLAIIGRGSIAYCVEFTTSSREVK